MQDQAIGYDSADTLPDRRSILTHAITGLGLLGVIVAILLIGIGRNHAAEFTAISSFLVVAVSESLANLFGPRGVYDNSRSADSAWGTGLGSFAALLFVGICYWVNIWPLADDAPVVLSRSGLSATFWIVLSMLQAIPRAYRIWRISPPNRSN